MPVKRIININRVTFYRYRYMIICYYERPSTRYSAMALIPPLMLLWKQKGLHNQKLYKHECIHHRQILELAILPFFVWYVLEYLLGRMRGMNHYDAYRNISFEKEAYHGENVPMYASKPRWFGFLRFLKWAG